MARSSISVAAARRTFAEIIGRQAAYEAAITLCPLPGGSEAVGVARVTARYRDRRGCTRSASAVIKHLTGRSRRELDIYRQVVQSYAGEFAPRLLGVYQEKTDIYMAIEVIRRVNAWPWRQLYPTSSMMRQLGSFHAATAAARAVALADWDYEADLAANAAETRMRLDQCRRNTQLAPLAHHSRILDRVVLELPRLRQMLFVESPLDRRPIHGDVHPGNAIIRRGVEPSPVLIDWGRARLGSPLEDVSSMLQSLRQYEPLAMRRHDSLWKDHLTGMGLARRITDPLRSAYWVAGACNGLAGALNVHLMTAADTARGSGERRTAFFAARDWLRVIRRAHAWAL